MILPEYYTPYAVEVNQTNFLNHLKSQSTEFTAFLTRMDPALWKYRYDENKWSVSEVLLHIIDNERIFSYRALRFARNDSSELQGYEHNDYVPESFADYRTPQSIINEFTSVRSATLSLFESFSPMTLKRTGIASKVEFDVEALGVVIAGHLLHHWRVIEDKYQI